MTGVTKKINNALCLGLQHGMDGTLGHRLGQIEEALPNFMMFLLIVRMIQFVSTSMAPKPLFLAWVLVSSGGTFL